MCVLLKFNTFQHRYCEMKFISCFFQCVTMSLCLLSEGFIRNTRYKATNKLRSTSDWSLPELYGPPRVIPLVPYNLVKSLMISKYMHSLSKDCDLSVKLCEDFRQSLNENIHSLKIPKARYGMIGSEYLIGFLVLKINNTTVITLESILPLYIYDSTHTNITVIKKSFELQYGSFQFNTTLLSPYWKQVFHLYDCYYVSS